MDLGAFDHEEGHWLKEAVVTRQERSDTKPDPADLPHKQTHKRKCTSGPFTSYTAQTLDEPAARVDNEPRERAQGKKTPAERAINPMYVALGYPSICYQQSPPSPTAALHRPTQSSSSSTGTMALLVLDCFEVKFGEACS
jgi:hypothetical protein